MVNLLVKYRLLEEFIREHWPNGAADDGRARLLRYETLLRRHSAAIRSLREHHKRSSLTIFAKLVS